MSSVQLPKKTFSLDLLIILLACFYIILSVIYTSGGVSPDSLQYFLQAQNFWEYKTNFPLGYATFIKLLSFLTRSYLLSSKIINILCYLGILVFSYRKKFYFYQTLIIFSFYPFINLYYASLSEPLYYFFNYIIIYIVYQITIKGFTYIHFIFLFFLFFFLISIRFSGIFVFVSLTAFFTYLLIKKYYTLQSYIYLILATGAGVFTYLLINYYYCGYFLGSRSHLIPAHRNIFVSLFKTLRSTANDFSFLNAFIHKGLLNKFKELHPYIGLFIMILACSFAVKNFRKISIFNIYILFSFVGILLGIIYTYHTTIVDDSIRIKSNAYLYLILFLVFNSHAKLLNYYKVCVVIILLANTITMIKYSENIMIKVHHFHKIISGYKVRDVEIIYHDLENKSERNNCSLLLFKSLLIDQDFTIFDSEIQDQKRSSNRIEVSEILK